MDNLYIGMRLKHRTMGSPCVVTDLTPLTCTLRFGGRRKYKTERKTVLDRFEEIQEW